MSGDLENNGLEDTPDSMGGEEPISGTPSSDGDFEASVDRFRRLFETHPEMLEGDAVDDQVKETRNRLHQLTEQAGPEADSRELVNICTEAYRMLSLPESFGDDPSRMRQYIEGLIKIDPRVALGAVFDMTNKEKSGVAEDHRASVMERTYDLVGLLNDMCQGSASAVGLARLRALLRYMMEPNYKQNTQAVQALCQGPLDCVDDEGNCIRWSLDLQSDDRAFDLGCGPGDALKILEQKVGEGNVLGIDFNPLYALRDDRIRIGLIDAPQERMACVQEGARERLSFENHFGKGGLVLASLVIDRVANQDGLLMNCKRLLRPGGTLAMPLLLPVKCEDDEPDLEYRLQYAIDPRTAGEREEEDYRILADYLKEIGFVKILRHHMPIRDPVSGRNYRNHYILIAQKKEGDERAG